MDLIFVTKLAAHEISTTWGHEYPKLYHYFMPSQDVILCLASSYECETAFTVWKNFPAVTDTFLQIATTPILVQ